MASVAMSRPLSIVKTTPLFRIMVKPPIASFSMKYKENPPEVPFPFDYMNKNYYYLFHHKLFQHYTIANIHDNTLFFDVESNFGVHRSKFTKDLADHIGFLHIPLPDLDRMHYMDEENTTNWRQLFNDYCLRRDRYPIPEEWHLDPTHNATIRLVRPLLQTQTYQLRYGLTHMYSTGQGIVTDRSYWSFYPIMQALRQHNFLNEDSHHFLMEYKATLDHNLKMPRLIIYIDKSPEEIWDRMQREGKDYQKKSKVYSLEFLRTMDRIMKDEFLPRMSSFCHILQYTEEELNIEDVVFDIEQLDFTVDGKFKDWRITNDLEVEWHRALLQNEEWWTRMFNINRYTRACEWRTEPNALKATVEMMKYDKRYEWKTNNWDIRPFFFNMLTWKRLPFY